jgi:hypothetical protein
VLLALLTAACDRRPPLAYGAPSSEALASGVLQALEARDVDRLRELALSETEFREHVWPELPAARPERNLPFSYVWGDLRQKSDMRLAATLARHGGRPYRLVGVRYAGGATPYDSFVVHRDTVLRVRTGDGPETELRLYGSTLEKDGVFKVFSYVIDD